MTNRRAPFGPLALLLLFMVIGGWLRVWGVNAQSLWFDEVFSQRVAVDFTVGSILSDGVAGDVHPPLYFVALNGWAKLVGDSALSLRYLSVLAMFLALPAFYHLGRLVFNARAGLAALGLAAFSTFQSYYAHEARQYAFSVLFGAWMLVGLVALVRGKRYGLPLYALAAVAGLYSHYYNGLLIAVAHLWLIAYRPARGRWRRWLIADVIIGVAFLPQAFIALRQAGVVLDSFWILPPGPAQPIATTAFLLYKYNLPGFLYFTGIMLPILALALSVFDIFRLAPRRVRAWYGLCWLLYLGVLLPLLIYSSIRTPIYLDRSFAFLTPVLIVLLSAAFGYLRRPSPTTSLVILIGILFAFLNVYEQVAPPEPKRPYQVIAAQIEATPAPILHLHDDSYLPLRYYAPLREHHLGSLQERSWLLAHTWDIFRINRDSEAAIRTWLAGYRGPLWVIAPSFIEAPAKAIRDELLSRACAQTARTYNPNATQPVTVYYVEMCR